MLLVNICSSAWTTDIFDN